MAHHILHIEDDANDVVLVQRAFGKADAKVVLTALENGEDAITYLNGEAAFADRDRYPLPSLVLLDLKLPGKSGLDVLSWIREHPSFNRLPVVVLTSSRQPRDINEAYERGVNSYLVKPVNFGELAEMIRTLCHYWLQTNEKPGVTRREA